MHRRGQQAKRPVLFHEQAPSLTRSEQGDSPQAPTIAAHPEIAKAVESAPSPFLFFDVWILAGVAILVAVVLGFRLAYSRVRGRRDPDDQDSADWLDAHWDDR